MNIHFQLLKLLGHIQEVDKQHWPHLILPYEKPSSAIRMFQSWRRYWRYDSINSSYPSIDDKLKADPEPDFFNEESSNVLQPYPRGGKAKFLPHIQKLPWIIAISEAVFIVIGTILIFGGFIKEKNDGTTFYTMKDTILSPTEINSTPHICGNSSYEARQNGCTFDQLNWSWLPPNCPPYANDLFIEAENPGWRYYETLEQNNPVEGDQWEEVLNGDRRVFVERREHLSHCVFRFLSIAQILRDGTPYHRKLADYRHSAHCANAVLDSMRRDPEWFNVDTYSGKVSFREHCEDYK